jgi:predicted membrane channel-forming protein YqfA (hemolysin III family)
MENHANPIHARLRLSGMFIIVGLVIQALSLLWNHPLSFIAFLALGGLLLAIGIVLYLLALVNMAGSPQESTEAQPQSPKG